MLPIQSSDASWWVDSGSNWWVNSVSRFSGGQIGGNVSSDTTSAGNTIEKIDTFTRYDNQQASIHAIYDGLKAGHQQIDSSYEPIAIAASQIQRIEAAMRVHQSGGLGKFGDQDYATGDDVGDDSSIAALNSNLLRDPELTIAAIAPDHNRAQLLSLLK